VQYAIDDVWRRAFVSITTEEVHVSTAAGDWTIRDLTWRPAQSRDGGSDGRVRATTTGTVTALRVAPGDHVVRGTPLLVLEAMKMEHEIRAPIDGVVRALHVALGRQVARQALLVELEPDA
jgi:biotin carboxyl carrier protein